MTDTRSSKPRRNLFRANALARYNGPLQHDIPHVLPPLHPGLVVAAAIITLVVAALWI